MLWLLCLARRYCSFFEVYRRPCHDDVWMDQDLSPERTWELRKEVSHIVRGGFEAEIVQTGQNTKHCSLSMPVQICTYCFCFWFWLAPTRVLKLWMTSDKNANNYIPENISRQRWVENHRDLFVSDQSTQIFMAMNVHSPSIYPPVSSNLDFPNTDVHFYRGIVHIFHCLPRLTPDTTLDGSPTARVESSEASTIPWRSKRSRSWRSSPRWSATERCLR